MAVFVIPTFSNLPDLRKLARVDAENRPVVPLIEKILNSSGPVHSLAAAFLEPQVRSMLAEATKLQETDVFEVIPTSRWFTIAVAVISALAVLIGAVWYFCGGESAFFCVFFLCKLCQSRRAPKLQEVRAMQPLRPAEPESRVVIYTAP